METRTICRKLKSSGSKMKDTVYVEPACDPVWDAANNIGMASVQGKKWKQLDRVLGNGWSTDSEVLASEWEKSLGETFNTLQKTVLAQFRQKKSSKEEGEPNYTAVTDGACVSAVFLQGNTLHIANTGDCHIFYVVIPKKDEFDIVLLNNPHRVSAEKEKERLKMFAETHGRSFDLIIPSQFTGRGAKYNGKLVSLIGVTRAFGFEQYRVDGLIHEPEFHHAHLTVPTGGKAFIVIVSSSLMKNMMTPESQIGYLVNKHCDKEPSLIAKALVVETARYSATAAVMPVTDQACIKKVRYTAMMRGLNNDSVSQWLHENFHQALPRCALKMLEDKSLQREDLPQDWMPESDEPATATQLNPFGRL